MTTPQSIGPQVLHYHQHDGPSFERKKGRRTVDGERVDFTLLNKRLISWEELHIVLVVSIYATSSDCRRKGPFPLSSTAKSSSTRFYWNDFPSILYASLFATILQEMGGVQQYIPSMLVSPNAVAHLYIVIRSSRLMNQRLTIFCRWPIVCILLLRPGLGGCGS